MLALPTIKQSSVSPRDTRNLTPLSKRRQGKDALEVATSKGPSSGGSNSAPASDLTGMTADGWFDCSNKRPANQATFDDGEPPYLMPRKSSSDEHVGYQYTYSKPVPLANDSGSDDYRNIIDDLTVENKKLKERLRRFEAGCSPHLEKDKLFEVKIHRQLPPRKRRELEEALHALASSIDGAADETSSKAVTTGTVSFPPGFQSLSASTAKQPLSSSASNSPLVDSAYVSMSRSGQTSSTTANRAGGERHDAPSKTLRQPNIQNLLEDIPEGLLPKYAEAPTERQKQKIVVRRLEQLFTGNVVGTFGDHGQPLQQQEISRSTQKAEEAEKENVLQMEGVREAHMFNRDNDMDGETGIEDDGLKMIGPGGEYISHPGVNGTFQSSLTQRPTRPLDLDPDRAQVPVDNVEYLRHLGQSTPQLVSGGDDPHGWVYLNLLINMAQLHIFNVTPNFVRSAVSDVSEKFDLSRDGRKIRWRGGSEGTRLGSDSGSSSAMASSRGEVERSQRKRRKIVAGSNEGASVQGHSGSSSQGLPGVPPFARASFHYKPLFYHQISGEGSTSQDDYSSSDSWAPRGESRTGKSWPAQFGARPSKSNSSGKWKRDDGPIVFYSGARFCTDLSGDCGDISIPIHPNGIGMDGYNLNKGEVVGCPSLDAAGQLLQTPSRSLMQFRLFQDCSCQPEFMQTEETRPHTPDLLSEEDPEVEFMEENIQHRSSILSVPLQDFMACGLGGTRPADHFALKVATRITKIVDHDLINMSKFSAPRLNMRKYKHGIPKRSLHVFKALGQDEIVDRPLNATASPPPDKKRSIDPSIKLEILSTQYHSLNPSILPCPTAYFSSESSSEEDSDSEDSYTGISHLRNGPLSHVPTMPPHEQSRRIPVIQEPLMATQIDDRNVEEEDEGDSTEAEDRSLGMLAHARQFDPQTVAAEEREFEMEVDRRPLEPLPAGSSAATSRNRW
ncbi:frequency clock protein [Amylocarpus encephaloides]|uniref:Frequency clock protein n=1 Tax=Amylocarpus encephaloides TaxID=45428 RepID=A0A9P8C116_9HELO|nr:frequency clock protein [Amylocarpus encephaloides]